MLSINMSSRIHHKHKQKKRNRCSVDNVPSTEKWNVEIVPKHQKRQRTPDTENAAVTMPRTLNGKYSHVSRSDHGQESPYHDSPQTPTTIETLTAARRRPVEDEDITIIPTTNKKKKTKNAKPLPPPPQQQQRRDGLKTASSKDLTSPTKKMKNPATPPHQLDQKRDGVMDAASKESTTTSTEKKNHYPPHEKSQQRQNGAAASKESTSPAPSSSRLRENSTVYFMDLCNRYRQDEAFAKFETLYKTNDYGWLRKLEYETNKSDSFVSNYKPSSSNRQPLHSPSEKQLACMLNVAFPPHDYKIRYLAHAWGAARQTLCNWLKSFAQNPLHIPRKSRSDKGITLLTSEKKRQSTWTVRFVFMKDYHSKHPGAGADEASNAWKAIEGDKKAQAPYQAILDQWMEQGNSLLPEIQKTLQDTDGQVSWNAVASMVTRQGMPQPVSSEAIRQFCQKNNLTNQQSETKTKAKTPCGSRSHGKR